eukprot:TRINITY_DN3959_c0_g1_i2.p1 TRINITY_DN3959_c0_g1~~TRINITY_DN3959_c0_g1_i2.p1  ORF type:complete len:156 (+),score=32.00 TRINITY_DN3959_c0_g1_i2:427-894(+)
MAKMYQEIALRNRFPYTPHFFLVIFFGKDYGAISGVKYVYVFNKNEPLEDELVERYFKKELLANQKDVEIAPDDLRVDLIKDPIPNSILTEEGKFVFIEKITPSTKTKGKGVWNWGIDKFQLQEDGNTSNVMITVNEPLPSMRTRVFAKVVSLPP